jgi:hypothetical protein
MGSVLALASGDAFTSPFPDPATDVTGFVFSDGFLVVDLLFGMTISH